MNNKAKQPAQEQKKSFQHFVPAIAVFTFVAVIAASVIGTIQILRRNAAMQPASASIVENLPGPKNQLSARSKQQLTKLAENDNVVGVMAIRYTYSKIDNPIIFATSSSATTQHIFDGIVEGLDKRQTPETGLSSTEAVKSVTGAGQEQKHLRNSEEAKLGLIKCVPIEETILIQPALRTIAAGVCYSTIPPFASDATMALVLFTNKPLSEYSELAEMRRLLLAVQIDIYNRDFKGRETRVHP